jgi:hypothetical protein
VGPAQLSYGWGLERYLAEILELEKLPQALPDGTTQELVVLRLIDSVYAAMPTQTREGGTTLLEELLYLGWAFQPAPREHIDEGVSLLNDLLDYERGAEGGVVKWPKLFLSEECEQTIFALKLWVGSDGRMGATKDPIDCLRYLACARLVAFRDEDLNVSAGGYY